MTLVIETERLRLRTWQEEDAEAYFQINQDPKVMEFLPWPMTKEQVHQFIQAANHHHNQYGYSAWATELKETAELIGFIGLKYIDWEAHFTPAVEIGWRLGLQYWGKGYATEGAKAALDYGFKQCNLQEIVSFAVPANVRSIRVMEKIGMELDSRGDFAHPKLPMDHPLSKHVLYRLSKSSWQR